MGKPSKPVAGPRFEEAPFELSDEAAKILTETWISERNRLTPGFESAPDARDDMWQRRRNPNVFLIVIDVIARISDLLTRREMRRSVVEDLGIPSAVRRRMRAAFDAAFDDPNVEVLHDRELRAELKRVVLEASRSG